MKSRFSLTSAAVVCALSVVSIGCSAIKDAKEAITREALLQAMNGALKNSNLISGVNMPAGASVNVKSVKDKAAQDGWFVVEAVGNNNGSEVKQFIAINTNALDAIAKNHNMNYIDLIKGVSNNTITLSETDKNTFGRVVLADASGGTYHDAGGNTFDSAGANQKDLEILQAYSDTTRIASAGRILAAQYGLSEDQGQRVAKLGKEWDTLSKSRQMTDADLDAFSQDLVGFSVSEARKAAKAAMEGNTAQSEALIEKAAANLETTPENVQRILATFN